MMAALEVLLDLQEIDTERDRIRHGVENLLERTELAQVESETAELQPARNELLTQLEGLTQRQAKHEAEVERLVKKSEVDSKRLYGGSITSPKDAEALTHEIETLHQHQATEEDAILELMERAEPLQEQLDEIEAACETLAERAAQLRTDITDQEAKAAEADEVAVRKRQELVTGISEALLKLYDQHRKSALGEAVGRLESGVCSACNLSLSTGERDRIAALPADEPVDCPECRALLVRV